MAWQTASKGLTCNWRPGSKGENEEEKLFEETVRNYSTFGEKNKDINVEIQGDQESSPTPRQKIERFSLTFQYYLGPY